MSQFASRKKILNICFSDAEGGLELASVKFAKKFQEEGHDSTLVCHAKSKIQEAAIRAGLRVISIDSNFLFIRFLILLRLIAIEKSDVIVTHRSIGLKMSVLTKLFFPRIMLISFLHTLIVNSKRDFLHRFFFARLDELVVFTEVQKENALKYLPVQSSQLRVVPHFVNTEVFHPKMKLNFLESSLPKKEKFRIGCVGRFDMKKGQIELVQAAKILKDRAIGFELCFVGRNTKDEVDVRSICEKRVQDFGLEELVQFFDFQDSISDFYQSFDLFVMPSYAETFGMVLIEAMACGCLCMATEAGGPVEILENGASGILVRPQSALELANAIEKVIADPKPYAQMRSRALLAARDKYSENCVHVSARLLA